ncbi:MAG: multiheme c-type cytochrome [Fimbriimonadaceae bacterium]
MRTKWFVSLLAAVPLVAGTLVLQSCGGEGGAVMNGGGGDTSITKQFLALLPDGQKDAKPVGSAKCLECHDAKATWQDTKHASVGVGCESCHGPGGKHVAAPSRDNILTGVNSENAVVCGQCHGPSFHEWHGSAHAEEELPHELMEDVLANVNLYARTNRCGMCHSGWFARHSNLDNPATTDDQIKAVAQEAIDKAAYTSTCVNCHSPHRVTGNLSTEGKEYQLRKPVFSLDTAPIAPGTNAATFTKFNHLCAQCHNGRGTNPADASLNSGTARPSMHDSNQFNMLMGIGAVENGGPVIRTGAHSSAEGQCSKCHMGGGSHTFTVKVDQACAPCHTPTDATSRTATLKNEIVNGLYQVKTKLQTWSQGKFGDKDLWDYTSLITALGKTPPPQAQVPIEIKRARHNYYFIVRDASLGVHNPHYARHLLTVANDNLDAVLGKAPVPPSGRLMTFQEKLASILEDKKRAARADMSAE